MSVVLITLLLSACAAPQDYPSGVRVFCDKTATFEPKRRGPVLRTAASKVGIRPCAMAELYEAVAPW